MSKGRLEAFSDGVLAVAITLLVLDLHVPDPGSGNLGHQLAHMWPSYAAYAISFLTIGIIWINHHAAIARLREVDHAILVLNLLLLMSICVLPFATSLFATYLREARGEHLAAAVYAGALLVMGVLFVVLNRHILISKAHLLQPELSDAAPAGAAHAEHHGRPPVLRRHGARVCLAVSDARDYRWRGGVLRAARDDRL